MSPARRRSAFTKPCASGDENELRPAPMTGQLLRFIAVGCFNTLLGFSIIVLLSRGLGMSDVAANLCGFALGACSSYVLNKTFTFGSRRRHLQAAPAFLLLIGVCMAAN